MNVNVILDKIYKQDFLIKKSLLREFRGEEYKFRFINSDERLKIDLYSKNNPSITFIFTRDTKNIDNLKKKYFWKDKINLIFLVGDKNTKINDDISIMRIDDIDQTQTKFKGVIRLLLDGITKKELISLDTSYIKEVLKKSKILDYQEINLPENNANPLKLKLQDIKFKGNRALLGIESNSQLGLNEAYNISNIIKSSYQVDDVMFYIAIDETLKDRKIKFIIMS